MVCRDLIYREQIDLTEVGFAQELGEVYEIALADIPDRVPPMWIKQARVAAHMFQSLESGGELVDRDGRNWTAAAEDLATKIATSYFANLYHPVNPAHMGLRREFIEGPPAEFPDWVNCRRYCKRPLSGWEKDRVTKFFHDYVTSFGQPFISEDDQACGDFHSYSDVCRVNHFKIYLDGAPLLTFANLENAFALLRERNLHFYRLKNVSKSIDDDAPGGNRIVLYFDQEWKSVEMKSIEAILETCGVDFRGPAQDVSGIRLRTPDHNYEIHSLNSNDAGLGGLPSMITWEDDVYDVEKFFREWLTVCFDAGKNPFEPYEASFVPVFFDTGDEKRNHFCAWWHLPGVAETDTGGLPKLLSYGEELPYVFQEDFERYVIRHLDLP